MPRSEQLSREQLLARQAFQLTLLDALRGIDQPGQILAKAARMLGAELGVRRCSFAGLSDARASLRIEADWQADRPFEGEEGTAAALLPGAVLEALRDGKTLVVADTAQDGRFADANRARGAADRPGAALVVSPVLRDGILESMLCLESEMPRTWSEAELSLVEEVALRTREAVDRARSEAALRASEQRYRSLFDAVDAGFCVVEVAFDAAGAPTDYRFLEVNASFTHYTGLEDVVGRWMRDIAPNHERHWVDLYGRVAKTGVSARVELPAQALDDRWYMVQAYRVDDPKLNHVAILFYDLTERRTTERALEASREELELAARAAELGRFDYRPREGTLSWDDRCRALFGLSPGVPVTYESAFLAGLHPDDLARADAAVAASLDPAGDHRFETDYRTIGIEDGVLRHVSAHGLAFFEGDTPVRLIGTVQDVTRERIALAELRETGQRLRLAGRATNDAIWDWDFRNNHVIWNAALEASYGHAPHNVEPTGEWWIGQIHEDDRARIDASIHAVVDGGGHDWSDEYRFRRADGSYADILDRGYVIRDDEGAPLRMVGAMLDVSARKAVERQLEQERQRLVEEVEATNAERERIEEALRQSQKMEAVGQLTGGLAHDFNNLLTGISGALEMMQMRIRQGRVKQLEKYQVAAQGAVRRAAALTHRLLAFSRRQTLDPKPTDVNRLVYGIEELIRRTVGPEVTVETVGKAGLWPTMVDPNQLENAILNLCINARDAMPDGGRITIETANKWLDDRAARERDLDPGQYVSICVTDTGTGMTTDVATHAFDPFFTTKPMGEGTGLGLSMIYGFARQSGGQVRIYTEVGMGTTMCIYLPRHIAQEGEDDTLETLATPNYGPVGVDSVGTVLVVDDEPTVRMLVVEIAEDMGFDVLEAADGPSAMKVLQARQGIDLLITDVGLPGGMNGRQVADAALGLIPQLRVLFITGYAENAVIGNGQLAPNMALVTKPFAMDELADRIRTVME